MCVLNTTVEYADVEVKYHVYSDHRDGVDVLDCEIEAVMFNGVDVYPMLAYDRIRDLEFECIEAWEAEGALSKAERAFDEWRESNEM